MSFVGNVNPFSGSDSVPRISGAEAKNEENQELKFSSIVKEEFIDAVEIGTRVIHSYTIKDLKPEKAEMWLKIMNRKTFQRDVAGMTKTFNQLALDFTRTSFPKAMGIEGMTAEGKAKLDRHICQQAVKQVRLRETRIRAEELARIVFGEQVAMTIDTFSFRDEYFKGKPEVLSPGQIDKMIQNIESRTGLIKRHEKHQKNKIEAMIQQDDAQKKSLFSSLGLLKFLCEQKKASGIPVLIEDINEKLLLSYHKKYQSFLAEQNRQELEATLEEKNEGVQKLAPKNRRRANKRAQQAGENALQAEEGIAVQPSSKKGLSPFMQMIADLKSPLYHAVIKLADRVKRWFTGEDPRMFVDCRNGEEMQFYIHKTPLQLKLVSAQHNLEGIDKLLSHPKFVEKYCFEYQYVNWEGKRQSGLAFKAVLNGVKGTIYAAFDDNGDIYHAMHDPRDTFDLGPMLEATNGIVLSQAANENKDWESPFTVEFEAGENETIIWKRGTKPQEDGVRPKHGSTIIIFPLAQ